MTLYTTPVVYLYLERLSRWLSGPMQQRSIGNATPVDAELATPTRHALDAH